MKSYFNICVQVAYPPQKTLIDNCFIETLHFRPNSQRPFHVQNILTMHANVLCIKHREHDASLFARVHSQICMIRCFMQVTSCKFCSVSREKLAWRVRWTLKCVAIYMRHAPQAQTHMSQLALCTFSLREWFHCSKCSVHFSKARHQFSLTCVFIFLYPTTSISLTIITRFVNDLNIRGKLIV